MALGERPGTLKRHTIAYSAVADNILMCSSFLLANNFFHIQYHNLYTSFIFAGLLSILNIYL